MVYLFSRLAQTGGLGLGCLRDIQEYRELQQLIAFR